MRNVGIDNIQKTVADYYKIKVADLSRKADTAIARPRQVAMWLPRSDIAQFPSIGDAFGGRDHTTVIIHAVKTIDSLRSKDNELNHDLHVLLQVLKGEGSINLGKNAVGRLCGHLVFPLCGKIVQISSTGNPETFRDLLKTRINLKNLI